MLHFVGRGAFACADVSGKTPPTLRAPAKPSRFYQLLGTHGIPHTGQLSPLFLTAPAKGVPSASLGRKGTWGAEKLGCVGDGS